MTNNEIHQTRPPKTSEFSMLSEYIKAMTEWIDRTETAEPGLAQRILAESMDSDMVAAEYIRWIKYQKKALDKNALVDVCLKKTLI